ncbi:hypothetical protein [Peribacillus simplex]|uniref:hypothetical protein n=1 Tax=Peribacillus simplex TaxID=1478 RepID=UPI0036DBF6F2
MKFLREDWVSKVFITNKQKINSRERCLKYQLDEKRKSIMDMPESKGEGEITIGQMPFPDIRLQIKSLEKKLGVLTKGTFYAENNHLHFD